MIAGILAAVAGGGGAAGAMTAIASTTLGSATASVTFNSIPATYDDLMLVTYGVSASGASTTLQFNGVSTTTYSNTYLYGDGASALSSRGSNQTVIYSSIASAPVMSQTLHIINYANTSNFKTTISRTAQDDNGSGYTDLIVGLWRSTSAITSLTVGNNSYSFASGSVFALYGIKKAA